MKQNDPYFDTMVLSKTEDTIYSNVEKLELSTVSSKDFRTGKLFSVMLQLASRKTKAAKNN